MEKVKKFLDCLLFEKRECPSCGGISYNGLCNVCLEEINRLGKINLEISNNSYYGNALFHYSKTVERLIYNYKTKRSYSAFDELLKLIFLEIGKLDIKMDEYQYIIYIPSNRRNKSIRGFDPSYELCRAISKKYGIKMLSIFNNVGNVEQKKLDFIERQKSIESSLKIKSKYISVVKDKNILIFDDVFTTGASINKAIRLLNEYSPNKLNFLVIVRRI